MWLRFVTNEREIKFIRKQIFFSYVNTCKILFSLNFKLQNFCQLSHKAFLFIKSFSLHHCKLLFEKKTCCDATLKNPKSSKVYGKLFQSSWPIKPHFFFTNKDKENNVLHVLLCTYYKADLEASATRNLANITFKDEQMIIKTWHNLLIYTRALFDVQ